VRFDPNGAAGGSRGSDNTNDERLAADGKEEYKKYDSGRYH